jgi:DNA-binding transcriptional LysR family regulator
VVPEGWEFIPLLRDRFAVIAGVQHPLALKRVLTFEDLLGATWLTMPVSVPARASWMLCLPIHQSNPDSSTRSPRHPA